MSSRVFFGVFAATFVCGVIVTFTLFMIPGGVRRRVTCYDEVYDPRNKVFAQPELLYSYPPEPYHRSIIAELLVLHLKNDGLPWLFIVSDNVAFACFIAGIAAFCVYIMRTMFPEKTRNEKEK